jgi:hypothetical protein
MKYIFVLCAFFIVNLCIIIYTSKSARALHRENQIVKRFTKSSLLILFFTIVDDGHGYITIRNSYLQNQQFWHPSRLEPCYYSHLTKTPLTRSLSPPTNPRGNFGCAPHLPPMRGLLFFIGKARPLFLLPGSAPFSCSLVPPSHVLFI